MALRQELGSLKLKDLRKRAKEAGMSANELEAAMDADDPEGIVIEFLMCQHAAAVEESAVEASLVSELQGLKLRELRKRAKEHGVGAEQLDEAMDADEPEAAVIELLVAQQRDSRDGATAALAADKPHHGGGVARSKPPLKAERQVPTKHVMLSYQWDSQDLVKRAYDLLTALGVNCWMVRLSLLSPFHSRRPDPVSWLGRILWAAWRATSTAAWRRAYRGLSWSWPS